MGYALYIRKRFWMVCMRVLRQLIHNSRDFSVTVNIPVQTESGNRDHNPKQFLNFQLFWISEETMDWNSNALPEEVYLKN